MSGKGLVSRSKSVGRKRPFQIGAMCQDQCLFTLQRLNDLEPIAPLLPLAKEEGFRFLDRLVREWAQGAVCFDGEGEAFYGVWEGSILVGVGGILRMKKGLGRISRVYVHPAWRRRGVGLALMQLLIEEGKGCFGELVLRTTTPEGAAFYESLGFVKESELGEDLATHRLRF